MSFTIEMLPAREGDCLWIEYGDPVKPGRILIDGGRGKTNEEIVKRINKVPGGKAHFELLVITHVDQDHIDGILNLFKMDNRPFTVGDVWFNGWRHLEENDIESLGPMDGELLTSILVKLKLPWNRAFQKHAVVVPGEAPLPSITLEGGMKLTLLSPSREKLSRLKPKWAEVCQEAGIVPGQSRPSKAPKGFEHFGPIDIEELASSVFKPDDTETNGSSIAFLAEHDGHTLLLAGDAHPDLLLESIKLAKGGADRLKVDAFKLPHHGSKANISREILETIDCPRYLISTSGARFYHPNCEAMARVIKFGGKSPELIFNYQSKYTRPWNNPGWMADYGYTVQYLRDNAGEKKIRLS